MKKIITYNFLLNYLRWLYGSGGDTEYLMTSNICVEEDGAIRYRIVWYIIKIEEEIDNTIILTIHTTSSNNNDVGSIEESITKSLKKFGTLNNGIHFIIKSQIH